MRLFFSLSICTFHTSRGGGGDGAGNAKRHWDKQQLQVTKNAKPLPAPELVIASGEQKSAIVQTRGKLGLVIALMR